MFGKLIARADCMCSAEVEIEYEKNNPNARAEAFLVVDNFNKAHTLSCAARLKRMRYL